MSWADFLFNHFIQNILPSDKKLLIDETSLCSISSFVQLLNERRVKFIVVHSTKELLKALHSDINLIIADQSNFHFSIPESIRTSCQTIKVDYENLPFNIDFTLYKQLRLNDLLTILNFASQNPQEFITDADTAKILEQSLKNSVIKTNKEFESIFENFATQQEQMTYNDVLYVGLCWGEYVYNCFKISATPDRDILHGIDSKVLKFIVNSGLKNLPYEILSNFKSVERICGYLKYMDCEKKALLCFDGMGWAEWLLLKEFLIEEFDIDCIEKPIFSMIPSTTRISRSAVFSGKINEIYQSNYPNERKTFRENFNHAELFKNSEPITEDSILGYTTVAKIYNLFDETAHNTILKQDDLSKNNYFNIAKLYLCRNSREMFNEIKVLLANNFKIFICSDHGCTAAKGNGNKIEKYLIDTYSKRGTIIKDNSVLHNSSFIKYQVPIADSPTVILAYPGEMYDNVNACELTHGGTSVEEIVIPFIEVKEKY